MSIPTTDVTIAAKSMDFFLNVIVFYLPHLVYAVGLWGYLKSRRLGWARLWKIIFFLYAAEVVLIAICSLFLIVRFWNYPSISAYGTDWLTLLPILSLQPELLLAIPELLLGMLRFVAWSALVMLVTWIPMLRALWRYSFRCAHIWNTDAPN